MLYRLAKVLKLGMKAAQQNMKLAGFSSLGVLLWLGFGLNILLTLLLIFTLYLCTGGFKFMTVVAKTLPRDLQALLILLKLKRQIKSLTKERKGIPSMFYEVCDRDPAKTCFIDAIEGRYWSYKEFDDYSNQIGNYFLSLGYQPGDSVAVFMESSPQYVATWLGLAKIGVIPALINYNLRLDSLVHCLEAATVKAIVYTSELQEAVNGAAHLIPKSVALYQFGTSSSATSLDTAIESTAKSRPPVLEYDFNSPLIYIYTSGTTGLPKAAKVVHSRYFYMSSSIYFFGGLNSTSIIYDTLPLYHTAGGILGVGQALLRGIVNIIKYI